MELKDLTSKIKEFTLNTDEWIEDHTPFDANYLYTWVAGVVVGVAAPGLLVRLFGG